ncbi:MAG: hypothetical protein A2Z29_09750 [Chloroflexi bacterium RBG_16_56_11]|nr:MAG: hypothetical protein A2Z29_09750 [Chloroflexi bacterium RBG_16_56_11]
MLLASGNEGNGGAGIKNVWVLPEIYAGDKDISKLSLGLLSEARSVAEKTGGEVTAILLSERAFDCSVTLAQYGIASCYRFQDPLFRNFSAEASAAALLPRLRGERPGLVIMGHTPAGRDLAPRLAASLETSAVTGCTRVDLSEPDRPKFYRLIYGGQLEQEIVLQPNRTMLVTMDAEVLNILPTAQKSPVSVTLIEPRLSPESIKTRHLEYLPADYRTLDITEADTIVGAGMGAATGDLLPMVEELAGLIGGSIGTTRPVIDGGKIPRERLIGQTGKVVSPAFYLALGISGSSHHVGGIQASGKIVTVNRDGSAPIFQNADAGAAADLRDILPGLIARIKHARENGEII